MLLEQGLKDQTTDLRYINLFDRRLYAYRAPDLNAANCLLSAGLKIAQKVMRSCQCSAAEGRWYQRVASQESYKRNLFRNLIKGARISEHAIVCGTGQQFVTGRAGRFLTTRWSVVLLSAHVAAEGRLGL
jgi:hypothetical protein